MEKVIIDITVGFRFVGGKIRVTLIPVLMKFSEWAGNFSNHLMHRNSLNVHKHPMKQVPRHPHSTGERWVAERLGGSFSARYPVSTCHPVPKPAPLLWLPAEGTERGERDFCTFRT